MFDYQKCRPSASAQLLAEMNQLKRQRPDLWTTPISENEDKYISLEELKRIRSRLFPEDQYEKGLEETGLDRN
jgi:hypothetical protein